MSVIQYRILSAIFFGNYYTGKFYYSELWDDYITNTSDKVTHYIKNNKEYINGIHINKNNTLFIFELELETQLKENMSIRDVVSKVLVGKKEETVIFINKCNELKIMTNLELYKQLFLKYTVNFMADSLFMKEAEKHIFNKENPFNDIFDKL